MARKVSIHKGVTIYPNVYFKGNYRADEGVILGFSKDCKKEKTTIGEDAVFRPFTLIYSGVNIGNNFQTGPNVLIREENIIGNDVVVWHGATLNPQNVIGDECRIHAGCFLEEVTLEKRVFLGPNVVFTDDPHPMSPPTRSCMKGATVEEGVAIGGNVTVLPHVRIGKFSVIGAGSVVTKDVPPFEVWVGSPAKFLKKIEDVVCDKEDKVHYPYRELLEKI